MRSRPESKLAARQRCERLRAWKAERAATAPADDRIVGWIDQELKRLDDPALTHATRLMPVHLSRSTSGAWSANQPRTPDCSGSAGSAVYRRRDDAAGDLKDALDGRGFAAASDQTPSLAGLLPLFPEPEISWLGRRPATELAVDSDLRFIRFHNMVLPHLKTGQPLEGLNLSSALARCSSCSIPSKARKIPWCRQKVGSRSRVGALVTRLDIATDMSQTTIEATMWSAPLAINESHLSRDRSRSALKSYPPRPAATSPPIPRSRPPLRSWKRSGWGQLPPRSSSVA